MGGARDGHPLMSCGAVSCHAVRAARAWAAHVTGIRSRPWPSESMDAALRIVGSMPDPSTHGALRAAGRAAL
eukprot:648592-Prymnesium_polylepis.1